MIYDVLLKRPIFLLKGREVEISENLMTIKCDVSIIFLINIREIIRHIKYTVYFI
jgi:hypothetical protein